MAVLLAGCNATAQNPRSGGLSAGETLFQAVASPETTPDNYRVGTPYKIAGRWYHPQEEPGYDEVGLASWYGDDFHGRRTASGEIYDMHALTAAHPTLPMPTYARVTNLENGRSVVVRINDRGPFANGRVIDLSKQTARTLDFKHNGTAEVRVQYLGVAPATPEDEWQTTTVRQDGQPVGPTMVAAGPDEAVAGEGPASRPASEDSAEARIALGMVSGYLAVAPAAAANPVAEAFRLFDAPAAGGFRDAHGLSRAPFSSALR